MKNIKIVVITTIIVYLCHGFIFNEFNPFQWPQGGRGGLILSSLLTNSAILFLYNSPARDEEDTL